MGADMQDTWERLNSLTIGELRDEHVRVFGWRYRTGNRRTLSRRIAWKLRELEFGGLSERARARAREIADAALVKEIPPPGWPEVREGKDAGVKSPPRDPRIPQPGTVLRREYKGKVLLVTVLADGFEYLGEAYPSLSAIARTITGTQWNGLRFFGLAGKGKED